MPCKAGIVQACLWRCRGRPRKRPLSANSSPASASDVAAFSLQAISLALHSDALVFTSCILSVSGLLDIMQPSCWLPVHASPDICPSQPASVGHIPLRTSRILPQLRAALAYCRSELAEACKSVFKAQLVLESTLVQLQETSAKLEETSMDRH